jgi:tetratricopeptide (TPR) repeat protein
MTAAELPASYWLGIADDLVGGEVRGDYPARTWARALEAVAAGLVETGCYERAIEVSDALSERFLRSPEPAVRRHVILGLHNKGVAMQQLGREEEAQAAHDEMMRQFGAEVVAAFDATIAHCRRVDDDRAHKELATALYMKAWALQDLGKPDAELAVWAELIQGFADNADPGIQGVVAEAREEHAKLSERPNATPS